MELSFDLTTAIIVGLAFLAGGLVKGTIGVGLPTIAIALLGNVIDLRQAVAILVVPILITNSFQALTGPDLKEIARRFTVLTVMASIGLCFGTFLLFSVDPAGPILILGVMLIANSVISLTATELTLSPPKERILSPIVGLVSGVIGGITGSQGIVSVMYLQTLRLDKEMFVQTLGYSFFISGVVWIVAIAQNNIYDQATLLYTALASVVSLIAVVLARYIRAYIPQRQFRIAVYIVLGILGANLIRKTLF